MRVYTLLDIISKQTVRVWKLCFKRVYLVKVYKAKHAHGWRNTRVWEKLLTLIKLLLNNLHNCQTLLKLKFQNPQ